jgi:hypothetical protein
MLAPFMMRTPLLLSSLALLCSCAQSGIVSRQEYQHRRVAFQVGPLPLQWRVARHRGANLAFHHSSGGTIAASGYCPGGDDVPLQVLTNHLLCGIKTQKELSSVSLTLADREALRTHLLCELDGVAVELDLVVLKKDGCTYDLQLLDVAPRFALHQQDFDVFVQGFSTSPHTPKKTDGR